MILEETKVFTLSPDLSQKKDMEYLAFAADIIKRGGLVAFPTETVYGLGANALDEEAVKSIFTAKGRAQDNPLIVHVCDRSEVNKYAVAEGNEKADILLAETPAPLTVILPRREIIPLTVTSNLETVAMRVPENIIARKLIELAGVPIAAPSANLSGKPSPTKAKHVIADMLGRADVILDGGDCTVGLESTVITLCKETPMLLRPGGFTYERLCDLLGNVDIASAVLNALRIDEVAESPGMKYKHYAPNNGVTLIKGEKNKVSAFIKGVLAKENCAVICYAEDTDAADRRIITVGSRSDNLSYALKMFDALRMTDDIEGIDKVYAVLPEDTGGISLAIYNRMLRAAAFNVKEL